MSPNAKRYTRTSTVFSKTGNGGRHTWTRKWVAILGLNSSSCSTSPGAEVKKGQRQKNPAATRRAEKRRGNKKDDKGKKGSHGGTIAVSKPTLDEELKTFKAIVRHITKYDIEQTAIRWFNVDIRPSLRRL